MKRILAFLPVLLLVGCSDRNFRNSTFYGEEHRAPRNYESSVLNEPNATSLSPGGGRPHRINGSGYGPERTPAHAAEAKPGHKAEPKAH